MMNNYLHDVIRLTTLGFLALFLSGCSTTQIKSVWKDPAYADQPSKVLVVVIAKEPINRRIIEDEFVLQLNSRGTETIASYTVLTDKNQEDQELVAKLVAQLGVDTVLISRLISTRQVHVYSPLLRPYWPHYYGSWPRYYRLGYDELNVATYSTSYEYALMESNLYDTRTDKLLWAVTTETSVTTLNQKLIKPYVETITNLMAGHGLLKK
jgi:hypothetical protein